jgi:hypothetical protein
MAWIYADRVLDTSVTAGTGALTLSGTAPLGWRTFSTVCATNDTFYYTVFDPSTGAWETGEGTYSALNTVARTTVRASTNANALVSFAANAKNVFIDIIGYYFGTVLNTPVLTGGSVVFAAPGGAGAGITQDNANLFWDNTNKRLGLGTAAAPTAGLHLRGADQTVANFDPAGSQAATIYLHGTGSAVGTGGAVMFGDSFGPFAAIKGYATSGTGPVGWLSVSTRKLGADTTFTEAARFNADGSLQVTAGVTATTGTFSGTVSAPGAQIQMVSVETGAVATGTTLLPYDDTIPQITEGDQYMTLAITPKSATSKLIIEVTCVLYSVLANSIGVALFQDATANALAAAHATAAINGAVVCVSFKHVMTSGTTSATTFRVRAGGAVATTVTFNGANGVRIYGGTAASSIVIREVV